MAENDRETHCMLIAAFLFFQSDCSVLLLDLVGLFPGLCINEPGVWKGLYLGKASLAVWKSLGEAENIPWLIYL